MEPKLIRRGLVAGCAAGLAAFVFARVFAEPLMGRAIAYEEGRAHAEALLYGGGSGGHETEVVSRAVQENAGLGLGMIVFGVAIGGLYAVAYALCLGEAGRVRPRRLAVSVALAGFVALSLVPFLKYPAAPPGAGGAESVRDRTGQYLELLGVSLISVIVAVAVAQVLRRRLGGWTANVVAGLGFIVVVGAVMASLPGHEASPPALRDDTGTIVFPGFPADVLAQFQIYALAAQAVLWAVLAATFAPLAARVVPKNASLTTRQADVPIYVSR